MNNVETSNFLRKLLTAIEDLITKKITKYCNSNCDQTRPIRITQKLDDGYYMVKYNNINYKAFSRFEHRVGEIVYVTICCGNFNNLIIN